jgi:hypothetical protein
MNTTPATAFKLVTKADAAFAFDVCIRTIDKYIRIGLLSPPTAVGAKEYWHPDDFMTEVDRLLGRHQAEPLPSATCAGGVPKPAVTKDSSAAHRQKSRQAAKLNQLNTGR